MAHDDSYFRLRIPDFLKDQVEAAANGNRRSMNAEIIARLEKSFALPDQLDDSQKQWLVETIQKEVDKATKVIMADMGLRKPD